MNIRTLHFSLSLFLSRTLSISLLSVVFILSQKRKAELLEKFRKENLEARAAVQEPSVSLLYNEKRHRRAEKVISK